ncbi:jg24289 [Pararge aegeria aegeria]|uniref:Jg24289 protein n=1 Tax=Pararge aegeria aegeria TaxID=348720 RepID=A0A8S4S826_9NEOP|nr:jg24289 [Pararge aegeria aegeria]
MEIAISGYDFGFTLTLAFLRTLRNIINTQNRLAARLPPDQNRENSEIINSRIAAGGIEPEKFDLKSLPLTTPAMSVVTEVLDKSRDACKIIAKDPYFDIDIVVGKPWRIYYTWNMKLDTKCLDIVFKNATQKIIRRIWSDMNKYLEQQPYWEAATLHMSLGSAHHEILLFADQGAAGAFLGVPNIIRDPNVKPMRKGVRLMKFQMKLVRDCKYLLVMDCHVGGASLAARPGHHSYRTEIAAEAEILNLGNGYPACVNEKNDDEHFLRGSSAWSVKCYYKKNPDVRAFNDSVNSERITSSALGQLQGMDIKIFIWVIGEAALCNKISLIYKRDMVYIFSRLKEIPKNDQLSDVPAKLSYRGRSGKSCLYRGHHRMPIPEADEEEFQKALQHRKPIYRESIN